MQIAVLLMLSNFFIWPAAMDWQMDQQNVAIRGTVVAEGTGRAVPGATVYATSPAFDAWTVSDAKGEFIFMTLLPGTYWLCASKGENEAGCRSRDGDVPELFAGFEYGATIELSHVN
jgi:Carboxypeptidase regulatory-like domain